MNSNEKITREIKKMSSSEREELRKKMQESLISLKSKNINQSIPKAVDITPVELTFWDRVLLFIFSLFGIMSFEDYIRRKRLKMIKEKVASMDPQVMNTATKVLYPQFGKYLYEIYSVVDAITNLLEITLLNPNVWDDTGVFEKKTCAEYLFEFLTNTRALFGITDLKTILSETKSIKRIFDRIDVEVENSISSLDQITLNRVNKIYTRLLVFIDLKKEVNFKKIIKYFLDDKGKISLKVIPDYWLIQELEKLCNILSETDITPMIVDVILALRKYIEEIMDKNSYEYSSFSKFSQILSQENLNKTYEIIEKLNLTDVVCVLKDDPDYVPLFIVPDKSLVNIYKDVILNKSKNYVSRVIKEMIKDKTNVFFYLLGKSELDVKESFTSIYTDENNERLMTSKMPYFVYSTAFFVVYSFYNYFWKPFFREAVNDIIVNGIFKEKYLKNSLLVSMNGIDEIGKDIANFVKDTSKGGEYYSYISKFFEDPNILKSESTKRVIQQKISIVNNLAGSIVFKCNDNVQQLLKYLKFVLDDYSSLSPEYILNVKTIKGVYNKVLMETISKGKEVLESVAEVLSFFTN